MAKAWKDLNEREKMLRRFASLKQERSPLLSVYQELSQQFAPANGRFFAEAPNRYVRDWSHIVDSTGLEAIETSVAGLMSIASSPARPWLRYTTRDPDLDEFHPVKEWMADCAAITLDVFANNNTYLALPHYYRELLTFATAAGLLLPHFRKVACHYPFTCGEYYLQQNSEGEVNTLCREFHMTVAQLAKRFGYENLSTIVQKQWRDGELDQQHHIAHLIEPREDRDESKLDSKNMAWRSVYWEVGNETDGLLDDSGFDAFPVLAPRWDTVGGDIYGTGPGNRALPHAKRLQIMTKRIARGVHAQMAPPTVWPTALKNKNVETQPDGRTFADFSSPQQRPGALYDVRPQLDHALLHLQDMRAQLGQAFFAQFFTKISNDERNDRATVAEISAIKQEGWLMLGPFAQRVFSELLSPMTQMHFTRLLQNGGFPPPPPELFGREVSVRMISPLAQAQEAVGAVADDRFVFQMGQVAAMKPTVLHSFNEQQWAQRYSAKIGADPRLVHPAEEVQKVIEAQNQALAAAQQTQMMESQSKAVKNLGTTPSAASGDTALADVGNQLAGTGA